MPTNTEPGESQPPITIPPSGDLNHSLSVSYACVPSVALKITDVVVPQCPVFPVERCLDVAKSKKCNWLQHALQLLQTENLTSGDNITWAAYHAAMQPPMEDPLCTLLLYEKAATPAMIKHGMDVIRQAIQFFNPGQIPVITFDQPLFALAKFVQWKWPNTHGERLQVVMLGGLHIEMAL